MTKAKTNALDALRSLIAERQQYEQWISSLESRREATPEHVFDRVKADYQSRLERVVGDIRGHAEELQLSISTLSSRLVEVARDEDTRREGLQEAELRAAVGEYEPEQWEQLRSDAGKALEKIAADRASLDGQLSELRAIQKLSEAGSTGAVPGGPTAIYASEPAAVDRTQVSASRPSPAKSSADETPALPSVHGSVPSSDPAAASLAGSTPNERQREPQRDDASSSAKSETGAKPAEDQARLTLEPGAAPATAAAGGTLRSRNTRTPPGGVSAVRSQMEVVKPDNSKTLKCPECGTPNYATEWYCERCGGELATM